MTLKERTVKERNEKLTKKLRRMTKIHSVKKRIILRKKQGLSQFSNGSSPWYLEDLNRLFHTDLKNLEDVEIHTKQKGQTEVFGVYLRKEPPTDNRKIGKTGVKDGEIKRKTSDSNMSYHLEEVCFIPCDSELASKMLEYILQIIFGRKKYTQELKDYPGVKEAIDKKFSKRFDLWAGIKKGRYGKSNTGTELFKPALTLELFQEVVNGLTTDYKDAGLNKKDFQNFARDYQNEAVDIFVECAVQIGDFKLALENSIDFYLLMKPRSGKNLTMLLALVRYYKNVKPTGGLIKQRFLIYYSHL